MNGESTRGIEDSIRRNAAALRSKANLTQQALADEMLLRGIAWTRETVAQGATTNRRLGFTEATALAACLDVPGARLPGRAHPRNHGRHLPSRELRSDPVPAGRPGGGRRAAERADPTRLGPR